MTWKMLCESVNSMEMELFISLTNEPALNPVEVWCQTEGARWVIPLSPGSFQI